MNRSDEIAAQQRSALAARLKAAQRQVLKPPPRQSLSDWSEQNFFLSAESSALPGRFRFDRAEFQRGYMDALSDNSIRKVVVMAAVQTMKTQGILNYLAYIIDCDPAPILFVLPDGSTINHVSKTRVDPLLRDVPCLRGKVADKATRDGGNTIKEKAFPGGHLSLVTANSPSQLAARPIRYLIADEIDKYEDTKEGDPLELARGRLTTFWNRKEVLVSSPTEKLTSRIASEYEASDKRVFMVPCHHCGYQQQLKWGQVKWDKLNAQHAFTDTLKKGVQSLHLTQTACYECEHCLGRWTDAQRNSNVKRGRWVITQPHSKVAGFHISHLYSSFVTLTELADEFLRLKHEGKLQEWVNLHLAETWDPPKLELAGIQWHEHQSDYSPQEMPDGVLLLTAGVDTQKEWLACEVVGWGMADESWSIEYIIIHGDPTTPTPWTQLTGVLSKAYTRVDGPRLKIAATCIDSGGLGWQQDVTSYAAKFSNVYAIKGEPGEGKAIFTHTRKQYRPEAGGGLYVPVGTWEAKNRIYHRLLEVKKPGPGYCHFPRINADAQTPAYDDEWFDGLASEERLLTKKNGVTKYSWVPKPGVRNEPLDCRVYATAARASLALIDLVQREKQLKDIATKKDGQQALAPKQSPKAMRELPKLPTLPGTRFGRF